MKPSLSRRDFLKLTGIGLGAMAFRPFNLESLYTPKSLPQFPESEIIGRILSMTEIMSRPSNDPLQASSVGVLYDDNLIEWGREVVGNAVGRTNQRFLETSQGYIWAPLAQPAKILPNIPVTEMPAGIAGFWAEVTVPYVDLTLESPVVSSWLQSLISYNFPPRLYYGQVVWIDQVRQDPSGVVYYRWNESPGHGYGPGDIFWADGAGLKILTEEDVAPINPDLDPNEKIIRVDLDRQTLGCFEGTSEVYFCRISSGAEYNANGEAVTQWATPTGELSTHWKIFSLNMSGGTSQAGYSTPAVPWVNMISGEGVAIHGTFWHNDFGERRSHGCINAKPEDARWIFRWTTPTPFYSYLVSPLSL